MFQHSPAVEGDGDIVEHDDGPPRILNRFFLQKRLIAGGRGQRVKFCFDRLQRVGTGGIFEQRHAISLRDRVRRKRLGPLKILRNIYIEEPAQRRQTERMRDLPGLSQDLNRDAGDWLAEALRRSLESRKAAPFSGIEFHFQNRKHGSVENDREGLEEAVDRGNSDGASGTSRVMEKVCDK